MEQSITLVIVDAVARLHNHTRPWTTNVQAAEPVTNSHPNIVLFISLDIVMMKMMVDEEMMKIR